MIENLKVGMRVVVNSHSSIEKEGDVGTVESYGNERLTVKVRLKKDNNIRGFSRKSLTEIKEDNLYLDEALKAVREDENMEMSWGTKTFWYTHKEYDGSMKLEDLLEETFSVRRKKPPVKELTVADIEEKYGCKVKIVK